MTPTFGEKAGETCRIPVLIPMGLWVGTGIARFDEPRYEFKAGMRGESVEVRLEGKHTVFAISGKGAVGAVTIRLKDGKWPDDIVLRLNKFDNVESFSVTTGRITFGGQSGLSGGGIKIFSRKMAFRFPNGEGKFEDGPSPERWMWPSRRKKRAWTSSCRRTCSSARGRCKSPGSSSSGRQRGAAAQPSMNRQK